MGLLSISSCERTGTIFLLVKHVSKFHHVKILGLFSHDLPPTCCFTRTSPLCAEPVRACGTSMAGQLHAVWRQQKPRGIIDPFQGPVTTGQKGLPNVSAKHLAEGQLNLEECAGYRGGSTFSLTDG